MIRSEYVVTVVIPLKDDQSIKLEGVTYPPESNSNLISLCQLRESGIGYQDDPTSMTLRRGSEVIAYAKRNQNLFILDTVTVGKFMLATEAVTTTNRTPTAPPATTPTTTPTKTRAMAISGRGRPTHLVSKHKKVRVRHRRLGHASKARVICTAKLTTAISDPIHGRQ